MTQYLRASIIKTGCAAIFLLLSQISIAADQQSELVIATGAKGGTYYPMGVALAQLISTYLPSFNVKVRETSGGVENIRLLKNGDAALAFVNAGIAWDASSGQDAFRDQRTELRAIAALSPNTMHIVVNDNSGIKTLADLKGRKVSTGPAGSGTEVIANRLFKAYGLQRGSDLTAVSLGPRESAAALESGQIDAFFFGGATPVAAINALSQNSKIKIRLMEHAAAVKKMNMNYGPLYQIGKIPAGTYKDQGAEVGALDVWDLLVANEKLDGRVAYEIMRLIFEHKDELVKASSNLAALRLETQEKSAVITLHPGAQRYLAEHGVQPFARQFGMTGMRSK